MSDRLLRYLVGLVERLELAAEEVEPADKNVDEVVSRIEQLLETLEDVRREFSLLRHLDPNGEARALRDLLEDELYGANSGGPQLFED